MYKELVIYSSVADIELCRNHFDGLYSYDDADSIRIDLFNEDFYKKAEGVYLTYEEIEEIKEIDEHSQYPITLEFFED